MNTLILMDDDSNSGHILKLSIQCFELVSGLKVNWCKSHVLGISLSDAECIHFATLWGALRKNGLQNIWGYC